MNNSTDINHNSVVLNSIGWLFGLVILAIGAVNTLWGNDPGFGIFFLLLAFLYFPQTNELLKRKTGHSIPRIAKILLGIFLLWASLGVGELFDKINLMLLNLQ
jgi:hypothetical protein